MAAAQAYPVRVDASLDQPLSRWLWLVKWVLVIPHYTVLAFLWVAFVVLSVAAMMAITFTGRYPRAIFEFNVGVLLAIPHYLIVGLFTGGGLWAAWQLGYHDGGWGGFGLIGLLAVIAAVILLVTGRYPEQIFDFALGMNRWVLRVAGYAGLMTDQYPPFRLDIGGRDPGTLTLPPAPGSALQDLPGRADLRQVPPPGSGGWTGGRIVAAVAGAVLVLCSVGLLGGGGVALWAQANRHGGYASLGTATYSAPGYALASEQIGLHLATGAVSGLIGTVRIQVTQASGTAPAFVGIAPASAADRYLADVGYATVRGAAGHRGTYTEHAGTPPAVPPGRAGIWTARAAGPGTQTLTWAPRSGDWMVVAMNADGSRPVAMRINVAATLPALPGIAAGLLTGGVVFLIGGVLLISGPLRRVSRN